MKKIIELPENIKDIFLECEILPNGEIISLGKTLGFYEQYKNYLFEK